MSQQRVVIVGGSMGALRAAEQLRARGHHGPVLVIGEEGHMPYNRPPLSKDLLGEAGDDDLGRLHSTVEFRRRSSVADVQWRLGVGVSSADLDAGRLVLSDGSTIDADGIVVASGLRPRRLPIVGPDTGRLALRTLEDCVALRVALREGQRVVIIGAGFIGCEVAVTARALGREVTVVDPLAEPLLRTLGADVGAAIRRHHEASGIRFEVGRTVESIEGTTHATGVRFTDGEVLPADVVVEAAGAVPNVEWLAGNAGLDLSDGVLCDNHLRVVGAERVVAVGDIARFPNPLFDDVPRRVEHWSMPKDTATRAARTLVDLLQGNPCDTEDFKPVPAFWSDQADLRLQSLGSPPLADTATVLEGDLDNLAAGVLVAYTRTGTHTGSLAINLPPARQQALRDELVAPAGTYSQDGRP